MISNLSGAADRLIDRGRLEAKTLEPAFRDLAEAGLTVLDENRGELASLSSGAFVDLARNLALGKVDEARRAWLADQAAYGERMSALDAAMLGAQEAERRRAERWDRTKTLVLAFLKAAGQVAIPLLLAAI